MAKLDHIDLVVFDLDETLIDWAHKKLFPDVPYILQELRKSGYKVALASYNGAADQMLRKFGIRQFFDYVVSEHLGETLADNMLVDMEHGEFSRRDLVWMRLINGLDKKQMLEDVLMYFNTPPERTVFFDDQQRFIDSATQLGIMGHLVGPEGLTCESWRRASQKYCVCDMV
jgi:HAD superfamily phosphatase (TIGR01681 family)